MERLTARVDNKVIFAGDILNTANYEDAVFERLCELEDMFENGQAVELPCRVGDNVYLPCLADWGDIEHYTIETVGFDKNGFFFIVDDEDGERHYLDELGKDCFLTEDQAKARLKELKGDNK